MVGHLDLLDVSLVVVVHPSLEVLLLVKQLSLVAGFRLLVAQGSTALAFLPWHQL